MTSPGATLDRILVVDDELANRELLVALLTPAGYAVATACDGLECIAMLERDPPPALVLLDVLMPGLDGIETCRRIRALLPSLPVVIVTALSEREMRLTALEAGADDLLTKPIDDLELLARVRNLVQIKALRDARERMRARAEADVLLRRVYEALGCGVLVFNPEGVIIESNDAIAEAYGVPRETLIGGRVRDFVKPLRPDGTPLPFAERTLGKVLASGRPERGVSAPFERKDGERRWMQLDAVPVFSSAGQVEFIVATLIDVTARHSAEQAVRRIELRFERVVDHISSALIVDDAAGNVLYANARFFELFAIETRDVSQLKLEDYIAPHARPLLIEQQRRLAAGASPQRLEYEGIRSDGSAIWLEATASAVMEAGVQVGTQSLIRDITDRKRTESALQLLSTGLEHLGRDAFFFSVADHLARLLDVDVGFVGTLVGPSKSRIRTLGLSVGRSAQPTTEFGVGGTPCEVVVAQQEAIFPENVRLLFPTCDISGKLSVTGCAGITLRDSSGRPLGIMGIMSQKSLRDPAATQSLLRLFAVRVAAEMARQRTEARFHDLFEFAPDAIVMVDDAGMVAMANRQSALLFKCSREELVDRPIDEILPPERAVDGAGFRGAAEVQATRSKRLRIDGRRRDGTTFPAEVTLRPLLSEDGVLIVTTIRDRSEIARAEEKRKALETQLFHAQKMEAIGTLAGGIAHDFNNILTAVFANVDLARSEIEASHPVADYVNEIDVAAHRASHLVHQILAFGRKREADRGPVLLRKLIDETAMLLRAALPAGVDLAIEVEEHSPTVLADATQIHQVLMNLGTNAWHALSENSGRIVITQDTVDIADGDSATPLSPGRYARVRVSDTGRGMDRAIIERIFEPFFTTKPLGRGTGLGLSVVHGIMKEHGGDVGVESEPGKGSTFTIVLPTVEAAPPIVRTQRPRAQRGGGIRVLYLDDEASLVKSTTRLLDRLGYRAIGHSDPLRALAAVRETPDAFDVVILDYNMPVMSGVEVARAIHALRGDLPIVLLSGHFDDRLRGAAAEAGIQKLMGKPYDAPALSDVLVQLAGGSSGTPTP